MACFIHLPQPPRLPCLGSGLDHFSCGQAGWGLPGAHLDNSHCVACAEKHCAVSLPLAISSNADGNSGSGYTIDMERVVLFFSLLPHTPQLDTRRAGWNRRALPTRDRCLHGRYAYTVLDGHTQRGVALLPTLRYSTVPPAPRAPSLGAASPGLPCTATH